MEIIHTTDLSQERYDGYMYKSVSLIKEFGMYNVITATKLTGHYTAKQMYIQSKVTCDYDQAVCNYQIAGGKM